MAFPLPPPSTQSMYWEHHIGGEGGRIDMRGMMVKKIDESWGFTGNSNFCPSKPMQWLQRADAFPYTQ
eukprot:15049187-Ditylum_brightwellii.AAC.1